jgi:uncharacterized protein YchJ
MKQQQQQIQNNDDLYNEEKGNLTIKMNHPPLRTNTFTIRRRFLLTLLGTILWLESSSMTIAFDLLLSRRSTPDHRHLARQAPHQDMLSSSHTTMIIPGSTLFSPHQAQAPLFLLFGKREEIQQGDDNDDCVSCACGSGLTYAACCGPLHNNATVYAAANASQVVRARYTAYAYGLTDFIVQSTHPENELFDNVDAFRAIVAQIQEYNAQTLEYRKCEVVTEEYSRPFFLSTKKDDASNTVEVALVRSRTHTWHLERQQETITTEDSAFTRRDTSATCSGDGGGTGGTSGGWLYRGGEAWSNARPYGMY